MPRKRRRGSRNERPCRRLDLRAPCSTRLAGARDALLRHDDPRRAAARALRARPVRRRARGAGPGRAQPAAGRVRHDARRTRHRARHRRTLHALGRHGRLPAGWVVAAARCGAARRRAGGRHASRSRGRDLRHRRVRSRGLRHARRRTRGARAIRVLAAAARGVGIAQSRVRQRRPLHAIRRAGAADVRRRAAGLPRRARRDAARRAPVPGLRAAGLNPLPSGRRAPLRRLRHAGHRVAGGPHPSRPRHARGGGADDDGAAREDRALSAAHLAAARARRRARRGERRAVRPRGQGLVVPRRPPVVRRDARRGHAVGRAAAGRAWAPRRS